MKASLLITLLKRGGWRENRRINKDIIFSHPDHTNLISVPDLGEEMIRTELLNEIFQAAGLKARVHKVVLGPAYLLNKLKRLFTIPTE